jgi:SAM-dependent methyltransferase
VAPRNAYWNFNDREITTMSPTPEPDVVSAYEHETWSRCAATYVDSFAELTNATVEPLLDAAAVSAGSRVLDIGTGPGFVAAAVQTRKGIPIGIDFAESMVSEARRRYPGIDFREANAEALPFADGEFDAVVGNFVFHHLARPDRVLAEAQRVVRSGGRMAFTVWADVSKLAAFGLFSDAIEKHANLEDLPHGPLFGMSDFGVFHSMMREAGFHDSTVVEVDVAWQVGSAEQLLEAFSDWAQIDAYPKSVRDAIENTMRENAKPFESAGPLTLPNPAILVSATK